MLFSYLFWLSCQPFPVAINDDRSFITLWEYKYISITVLYIFPTPQIGNLEPYMLSWKKDTALACNWNTTETHASAELIKD